MVLCKGQEGTSAGEETGDGGGGSDERRRRGRPARVKWGGGKGGERGKKEVGKREESHRRWGGTGGQEWRGLGGGLQSLGLHQLLSGGGSLCTLFFFILSRYSCWDTASTDARISSSSQSFRPAGQEEGKRMTKHSACLLLTCR